MARIIYTALVAGIKGSINGSVIQSSSGGDQIRSRVKPRNIQSASQGGIRNPFQFTARQWSLISNTDRTSWSGAALPGETTKTAFNRNNFNLNAAGQALVNAYAFNTVVQAMQVIINTLTSSQFTITAALPLQVVPTDQALIVYATKNYNAGYSNFNPSDMRIITVLPAGTDLSGSFPQVNLFTSYVNKFGAPVSGQKLWVRSKIVDITNGDGALGVPDGAIIS